MQVGDKVKIEGDEHNLVYLVAGVHDRGLWLTVEDDEYDGYNGDLIVHPNWLEPDKYSVVLADERSDYHGTVRLIPA